MIGWIRKGIAAFGAQHDRRQPFNVPGEVWFIFGIITFVMNVATGFSFNSGGNPAIDEVVRNCGLIFLFAPMTIIAAIVSINRFGSNISQEFTALSAPKDVAEVFSWLLLLYGIQFFVCLAILAVLLLVSNAPAPIWIGLIAWFGLDITTKLIGRVNRLNARLKQHLEDKDAHS